MDYKTPCETPIDVGDGCWIFCHQKLYVNNIILAYWSLNCTLRNLVKSWNFGCKRPLKLTFSGDEGRMVKRLDIWPLFGLKRFDLNRKWLHRKPKRQVWINLNFMLLQRIDFFRKMSFWGHLESGFRQKLLQDKVKSAATSSSKLNQAMEIIIIDLLECWWIILKLWRPDR